MCYIMNISPGGQYDLYYPLIHTNPRKAHERMNLMPARTKDRKHPRYFRIVGYQIICNLSDEYVAGKLGCSVRTYRDKINGSRDFTVPEMSILAKLFDRNVTELISTD